MTRIDVLMLVWAVMLCAAGCSLSQEGLRGLGPVTWSAYAECGNKRSDMAVGEVATVEDGWSCIPLKPDGNMAWVRCWHEGDAEFLLAAQCEPGFYRSLSYIGDCLVTLTCEGGSAL